MVIQSGIAKYYFAILRDVAFQMAGVRFDVFYRTEIRWLNYSFYITMIRVLCLNSIKKAVDMRATFTYSSDHRAIKNRRKQNEHRLSPCKNFKSLPPEAIWKSFKNYLKRRYRQGVHKFKKCSCFRKLPVDAV